MKRAIFWILVIIGFSVAWLRPGHADPLAPQDAINYAKQTRRLPEWFNFNSRINFKFQLSTMRVFSCIEGPTGQHWTGWTDLESYADVLHTGLWTPGTPVPTTAADERVCWPATGPVSLGEPAYYSLSCPQGCREGKPINWVAMNKASNIAGATVKGEPCGPASIMGFYELPRLHTGTVVPVTRCAP